MKIYGTEKQYAVFGYADDNTHTQMQVCMSDDRVIGGALMGDNHLGYSAPIGSVFALEGAVSPSMVGYDIGCGNMAVCTDACAQTVINDISSIMDEVCANISFGVGRFSKQTAGAVDASQHPIFDQDVWNDIPLLKDLKQSARNQLGTVGSGNHYVDIFLDQTGKVWIGNHFGSRGLGHKIASHYIKVGGGKDGINVAPVILDADSDLGAEYIAAMKLAGAYAEAGREWVCGEVARILGASISDTVHNNHNFAWEERHYGKDVWTVRKGATPAFLDQYGFVGATMGEDSVILKGKESAHSVSALYSTVHGAGRIMSRTEAAGKTKFKNGVKTRISEGKISQSMMDLWVADAHVELRGGGLDESPHAYKRLDEVLSEQGDTIQIVNKLTPIGVAMAPSGIFDPFAD